AVFLDDSPFERGRVREALPHTMVPDLPPDPMEYASWLQSLRCFDNPLITEEDRARTRMYAADRQRKQLKSHINSLGDWLRMLDLAVRVEPLKDENIERASQLFNKTNQMNLSTRRLTATELMAWANENDHKLWTF